MRTIGPSHETRCSFILIFQCHARARDTKKTQQVGQDGSPIRPTFKQDISVGSVRAIPFISKAALVIGKGPSLHFLEYLFKLFLLRGATAPPELTLRRVLCQPCGFGAGRRDPDQQRHYSSTTGRAWLRPMRASPAACAGRRRTIDVTRHGTAFPFRRDRSPLSRDQPCIDLWKVYSGRASPQKLAILSRCSVRCW